MNVKQVIDHNSGHLLSNGAHQSFSLGCQQTLHEPHRFQKLWRTRPSRWLRVKAFRTHHRFAVKTFTDETIVSKVDVFFGTKSVPYFEIDTDVYLSF